MDSTVCIMIQPTVFFPNDSDRTTECTFIYFKIKEEWRREITTRTRTTHSQLGASVTCCTCMHVCVLCTKVPPLEAVHWPQVAFLSVGEPEIVQEGPRTVGFPNLHPFLRELFGVC